jgi:hypothetical protein
MAILAKFHALFTFNSGQQCLKKPSRLKFGVLFSLIASISGLKKYFLTNVSKQGLVLPKRE